MKGFKSMKEKNSFKEIKFDHYYDYEELTYILKKFASENPSLAKLRFIGKTPEDRELWLIEITNLKNASSETKPAIWIDGNTHAGEVMGSMICLKTIWYLLKNYILDPFITRLLNDVTFYIVPRVDPDGAEFFLKTSYYVLGGDNETGGGRWYPLSKEKWASSESGLYLEDINGDDFIVSMRIKDQNGEWKISKKDNRIMVKREPGENEGDFYRIYPEGYILNYNGDKEIKMASPRWSLNFNRNYPDDWAKEDRRRGSGAYPLSEPETRAIADFIVSHPNICLAITYHTHGGVIFGYSEEEKIPKQDRKLFKILESIFVEETGYPALSLKSRKPSGSFSNYLTLHRGIPCLTVEVWDLAGLAGIGDFIERRGFEFSHLGMTEEQAIKVLKWNEKELDGKGFINWFEYEHPQIGKVEIGGWKKKFLWRNPPEKFIEKEIDKVMLFPIKCAELLPKVRIINAGAKRINENIYEIKINILNNGAIPTYIMKHAINIGSVNPVEAQVELEDKMKLIKSKKIEKIHLEGYLNRELIESRREREISEDKFKKTLTWLIKTKKSGKIKIKVNSQKAGKDHKILNIIP